MTSAATSAGDRPLAALPTFVEGLLVALLVAGIVARFHFGDEFIYTVFTDRDLLRALTLLDEFEYMGAEAVGHVARTPGGALAYVLWLLQQISTSTLFVYRATLVIDILAMLAIPVLFAPLIGRVGALFTAASYGITLVVLENLWKFWNPSFTPALAVRIAWLLMAYVGDGRRWRVMLAFALIGVAGQVHISFFALLPIVMFYLVVALRRFPLTDIALGLLAMAATLVPYVLLDAGNGFENTIALFVRPETAGVVPGVTSSYGHSNWAFRIFTSLAWVTGGRTFSAGLAPAALSANPLLLAAGLAVLNASLFALVALALMLAVGRLRGDRTAWLRLSPAEIGLIPLSLLSIAIGYRYADNASARYFLFLFMPALVLTGVAFREALAAAERVGGRRLMTTIGVLAALGLAAKHGAIAYHYASPGRNALGSFRTAQIAVDTLRRDFGYSTTDIEFRVAALYETPSGDLLFPSQPENLALTYLARTEFDGAAGTSRYSGCALVMAPVLRGAPMKALDERMIANSLPERPGFRVERVIERDGLRVVGYGTADGNCLRSFGNAYILTEEEKLIDRVAPGLGPRGSARVEIGESRQGFVVNPVERGRLPLLLEIDNRQRSPRVIIHANGARGYAPSARYERVTFTDVVVRFSPVSGPARTAVEYRADAKIGEGGLLTPWRLDAPAPLEPGLYALDLEIGRVDHVSGADGPVKIHLDDRFRVGLAAAAGTDSR